MEFLDNNIQPAREGDGLVCYHCQVSVNLRGIPARVSAPGWFNHIGQVLMGGGQKAPDYTRDRADKCYVMVFFFCNINCCSHHIK